MISQHIAHDASYGLTIYLKANSAFIHKWFNVEFGDLSLTQTNNDNTVLNSPNL